MSDPTSSNPSTPAEATASSTPAPTPEAAAVVAAPSDPAAKPAEANWTSLALAVAVVTVGGFVLGRVTAAQPPPAPGIHQLNGVMNRNFAGAPVSKVPPAQLLQRLREARGRKMAVPPSTAAQLANPTPAAAVGPAPGTPAPPAPAPSP